MKIEHCIGLMVQLDVAMKGNHHLEYWTILWTHENFPAPLLLSNFFTAQSVRSAS